MRKKTALTPARSNGKHPGGRPSKYTENTLKIAADYILNYEDHGDMIPILRPLNR